MSGGERAQLMMKRRTCARALRVFITTYVCTRHGGEGGRGGALLVRRRVISPQNSQMIKRSWHNLQSQTLRLRRKINDERFLVRRSSFPTKTTARRRSLSKPTPSFSLISIAVHELH